MVSRVATRVSNRAARKRVADILSDSASSGSESENDEVYRHENANSASEDEENGPMATSVSGRGPARKKQRNRAGNASARGENTDFEENRLFQALSLRGIAINDLALEWLEAFDQDLEDQTCVAITELFNLILRACGCTYLVKEHDMINEDSAPATVAEIAEVFGRQALHEYPFVSTHKNVKHFRQNMLEFFRNIVSAGHEKGSLYKTGPAAENQLLGAPMVNCVLAWLLALSASPVRPLRFVATLVLLDMQTQLCDLASTTTIMYQKQQRQLSNARNNMNGRNRRVQQNKIDIITELIDTFKRQKDTILEYIGDIFRQVFVHRYRDVDTQLRSACVRALAQWMTHFEEFFLRADYLRYIGWLLSDPTDGVRLETVRLLLRLYRFINGKREAMSLGFRQFTERFKDQFIQMAWKEKLLGVKVCLLEILTELYHLSFLTDSDVNHICLLGFFLAEHESTPLADLKAKTEVCKFMAMIADERSRTEIEPLKTFLETYESSHFDEDEYALNVPQCLKYKALAALFETSNAQYKVVESNLPSQGGPRKPYFMLIDLLFRVIYSLPGFQGLWEGLTKYLLFDFSSIRFSDKSDPSAAVDEDLVTEVISKVEIASLAEKYTFLSFVSAAVIYILTKEPPKKATAASNNDDLNAILPLFVKYIAPLEEFLSAGNLYAIYMSIWNSILIALPTSIARLFCNVGDVSDYNAIHDKVLHYYFDMTSPNADLLEAFDTYFLILLKSFQTSTSSDLAKLDGLLNSHIKMQIEDLLHSLAIEGTDVLFLVEPIETTSDSEEDLMLQESHKVVVNRLLRVTPVLQKFSQVARVMNISKYVAEPTFGTSNVLLEVLQVKVFSKFDFLTLIQTWPNNYAVLMSQLSESWECALEFILLALSWKLEDLTYASNDNSAQHIDISLFLEDFNGLCISAGDLFVTVGQSAKELNESTVDTNTGMRSLVENLVSLEDVFATHYIDMLVSFRTFYDKFRDDGNFKNFQQFFDNEAGVGALIKGKLPDIIQESLMRVFFIHESRLAQLKGVFLDRQHQEEVNYSDYVFESDIMAQVSTTVNEDTKDIIVQQAPQPGLDSSSLSARKEQQIWAAEKVLCVYTVKLYSLVHTGAFSSENKARIQLNSRKLKGLFRKIVEAGEAQGGADMEHASTEPEVSEAV